MPWGRLDDGLYDHPKLDKLGRQRLPAIGLWTLSISWCNRRLTNGYVPCDRIRLLGGTSALADLLVAAELFERLPDGYLVHDFLEFNDSAESVQSRRDSAAERQRRHRSSARDATRDNGVSHEDVTRESLARTRAQDRPRPGPARPVPDQGSTGSLPKGGARAERRVDPSDELTDLPAW